MRMAQPRYSYDLLLRHSNDVAINTRRALKQPVKEARKLFSFLGTHFHTIEQEPAGLPRNVRLALTARFINHQFSELMLIERGLLLDAFNCARSALEATAFYWLVTTDPTTATLCDSPRSPRPIEIRKRLEDLGIDIAPLRELYTLQSEVAHVGNATDHLQIQWEDKDNGHLLVGGGGDKNVQQALLIGMVKAVFRYVKHDTAYIVPDLDKELPDFA